jgi:hypothetical protein
MRESNRSPWRLILAAGDLTQERAAQLALAADVARFSALIPSALPSPFAGRAAEAQVRWADAGTRPGLSMMGRASRRKSEPSAHAASTEPPVSACEVVCIDKTPPAVVYRFFQHEREAECLASGSVWVTTLETCRRFEGAERGDAGEGTLQYNSGVVTGDSSDPVVRIVAERVGVRLGASVTNIVISGNTRVQTLADAYVMCTTELPSKQLENALGRYCVRIDQPLRFFRKVTRAIQAKVPLRRATIGRIMYADRTFEGVSDPPGRIGFVKPPDIYAKQQEVRMLWVPVQPGQALAPFLVECPSASRFCRRVS